MSAPARLATGSAALCTSFGCWLFADGVRSGLGRIIGGGVAGTYVGWVVLPHPWLTATVAGTSLVGWLIGAWDAGDANDDQEQEAEGEEWTTADTLALVWGVVGEDRGALLTALRDALEVETTKEARAYLDEAGIRVRAGVRTQAGNGPGVHKDDLPDLPSPDGEEGPVGVVVAGEGANANANNAESERIGEGGWIRRDRPATFVKARA